ncbi:MAG: type II toxin-antitoxin system HicA family toxin [Patescibacteria group bacterium]
MSRLFPIDTRRMEQILQQLGFRLIRQKGSHAFYKHPDRRITMIPLHYGEDIGRGLLQKIITEDLHLSIEQFNELR